MAKVTFGGGVSNIQGSIAGNCFTRTKAGTAIRNKVKPNNPASPAQMRQREAFTRISKSWKTLTEEERLAWDSFAKLSQDRGVCGNIIAMTGHQGYMQMNLNRFSAGQEPVTTPDDVQNAVFKADFFGPDSAFIVRETPPSCIIPFGDGAAEDDQFEYWLSGPKSPGKTIPFKQLKLVGFATVTAPEVAAGNVDIAADTFFEMFGTIQGTVGKKWTGGFRQYSKSIYGVPRIMTTIVTAT